MITVPKHLVQVISAAVINGEQMILVLVVILSGIVTSLIAAIAAYSTALQKNLNYGQ